MSGNEFSSDVLTVLRSDALIQCLIGVTILLATGFVVADATPPRWIYALAVYTLFKWVADYRKCTVSYIEVKLRGVPKEDGYLYNFLNALVDFRYHPCAKWVYAYQLVFIYYYGTKTRFRLLP